MTSVGQILFLILNLAKYIIIAHIIMSWLINFQVLNVRQPLVYQIWNGLEQLLAPAYRRIRAWLPNTGGLDFAPLIAFFAIIFLQIIIRNNL